MIHIEYYNPALVKSGQNMLINASSTETVTNYQIEKTVDELHIDHDNVHIFGPSVYPHGNHHQFLSGKMLSDILIRQEKQGDIPTLVVLNNILTKDDWLYNEMLKEFIKRSSHLHINLIVVSNCIPSKIEVLSEFEWIVMTKTESEDEKGKLFTCTNSMFEDFDQFERCYDNLTFGDNALILFNQLDMRMYWLNLQPTPDPEKTIIVKVENGVWFVDGKPYELIESEEDGQVVAPQNKFSWSNPFTWL